MTHDILSSLLRKIYFLKYVFTYLLDIVMKILELQFIIIWNKIVESKYVVETLSDSTFFKNDKFPWEKKWDIDDEY